MNRARRIRPRRNDRGVSDVVASILILAITVVLFSTVFYWFYAMPAPAGQIYADMKSSFEYSHYDAVAGKYVYNFTLTHLGGDVLVDWKLKINLAVSGQDSTGNRQDYTFSYKVSDSSPPIGDTFGTGATWRKSFSTTTLPSSTTLSVYLVETERNEVFWAKNIPVSVKGGPYLVDKGVLVMDAYTGNYNPAGHVLNDVNFKIFLQLFDPQGLTKSVTADMTPLAGSAAASMNSTTFGERYQSVNPHIVSGYTVTTEANITVTVRGATNNILLTTVVKVTIIATSTVSARVDLGQMCKITWAGLANTSVGQEIEFSNDKPMTSEPILIRATVRNLGALAARNATVRFYDGPDAIGSVVTSVPALGKIGVSLTHTFSKPGIHTIFVNVTDVSPADQNPDITIGITPGFRNLFVSKQIKVYVYYDDMESGMEKWRHESTLLRINGEGPLEYENYSRNINIVDQWDTSRSNINAGNWTRTSSDYQTYPYSYSMQEVPGRTKGPLDVVLVVDRSASMWERFNGRTKLDWAKQAAMNFVYSLNSSKDRVALWSFSSDVTRDQTFTSDFKAFETAMSRVSADMATAYWDCTCLANNYATPLGNPAVIANRSDSAGAARADAMKAVIVLTDGNANRFNYYEMTPGLNLIRSNYDKFKVRTFAIGLEADPAASYLKNLVLTAIAGGGKNITAGASYTSDQYFYAPNAAQLDEVYKQIQDMLSSWGNSQQSIADPDTPQGDGLARQDPGRPPIVGGTPQYLTSLECTDDSQICSGSPTTVFGSSKYMTIGKDTTAAVQKSRAVLKFDVAPIVGATVQSAYLTVFYRGTYGGNPNIQIDAYEMTAAWTEGTATWNSLNALHSATSSGTLTLGYLPAGWKQWNITALVQKWSTGAANNGLMLRCPDSTENAGMSLYRSFFTSEETDTGYMDYPIVNVVYSGNNLPPYKPSTPSGPNSGITGATYTYATWTTDPDKDNIRFGWDWNGDGTVDEWSGYSASGMASTRAHTFASAGTYLVRVMAQDTVPKSSGWSEIFTVTISNGGNAPPNAPSMPSGPTTGLVSTALQYSTTGSDPNGDTLVYGWDWNGDVLVDEWTASMASGTTVTTPHTFPTKGMFLLRAIARDPSGSYSSWSSPLFVNITTQTDTTSKYAGNKSLVTMSVSLGTKTIYESAKLSFNHKYDLLAGSNGGAIFVGLNISGTWRWRYVNPQPTYTGNLNITTKFYDDNMYFPGQSQNQRVFYAYNGKSGGGGLSWEYAQVDLTPFIPGNALNSPGNPSAGSLVKIRFQYVYSSGGISGGWWLDNVEVKATRNNNYTALTGSTDIWMPVTGSVAAGTTHSGTRAWYNSFQDGSGNPLSIDNSLITTINLVQVKNASLQFYTRFNINNQAGSPPDGFRVEVSENNGANWRQINVGPRAANGTSGTGTGAGDMSDGIINGKSYSGIRAAGDNANWVAGSSLTRLNCDLTPWAGKVILLRFRVIINNVVGFRDWQVNNGMPGMYLDDIVVTGYIAKQ